MTAHAHNCTRDVPIIIQMGHNVKDTLRSSYWLIAEQFFTPFYMKTMKCDRFLHILRSLQFNDHMNQSDKNDNSYDRLQKIKILFNQLSDTYDKFYSPFEHLAVDKLLCSSKGE
jgi:hypothetical protein